MEIRLMMACAAQGDADRLAAALQAHAQEEPAIAVRTVAIEYASSLARTLRPDVALIELEPGMRLLPALAHASAGTRTLLMYAACTRGDTVDAIRAGAFGCVSRSTDARLLAKAVRTVFAGSTWFGRTALLQALRSQIGMDVPAAPDTPDAGKLTQREEEILRLIGQGLSNKEIGRRLDISDHTVKTHLHRVYAKLHQSGRYKAFLAQARA